jgi:hypothetical protein
MLTATLLALNTLIDKVYARAGYGEISVLNNLFNIARKLGLNTQPFNTNSKSQMTSIIKQLQEKAKSNPHLANQIQQELIKHPEIRKLLGIRRLLKS